MITFWRIISYSWKNLFRNAWIGTATIFAFTMAVLSVNVLVGAQTLLSRAAQALEEKVDVTITFTSATPEHVITEMRFYLQSLSQVRALTYVSSDEALTAFRIRHAQDQKVLDALDEVGGNPLGAQLVIKARSPEEYPFIIQAVQGPQYASYIQKQTYEDHRAAIARIQSITRYARIFGALLVAVFSFFGLLIVFNAIRVAVYTQREEIAIMRLVGASSFFIRAPFVLEGIWLACFALVLANGLSLAAFHWLEPSLRVLLDGDVGIWAAILSIGPKVLLVQAVSLLVLTTMVSWAAVGRYIRR